MPGTNADVWSPGGLVRPTARFLPGYFRRSEYGTVIPPSIVPRRPDCVFDSDLWRGLEQTARPDTASDLNAWHGMRASVEHDASSEVWHDRPR